MTTIQQFEPVTFESLSMVYQRSPQPIYDIPFSIDKLTIISGIILTILCSIFAVRTGKYNRILNTPVSIVLSASIAFSGTIFMFCSLILSGKVL
ncbi:Transmembrane domain-containing protein [Spironucleus salmonicida]|uniref:Transmembrane domain-containing protein n=1 Tax=Spironucleus salmonicida TaxID=348837 RepID=V6LIY2_9EUKA|nr:Transmembrane domain-containing protein [Spironucleus salmonicida]|eukprot:EST44570.1 Transmembrane domain-containing protein [Spironucleus salmonicida]